MDGPKSLVLYAVGQAMRKYPLHREDMLAGLADTYHCDEALLLVLLTRLQKEIFDE